MHPILPPRNVFAVCFVSFLFFLPTLLVYVVEQGTAPSTELVVAGQAGEHVERRTGKRKYESSLCISYSVFCPFHNPNTRKRTATKKERKKGAPARLQAVIVFAKSVRSTRERKRENVHRCLLSLPIMNRWCGILRAVEGQRQRFSAMRVGLCTTFSPVAYECCYSCLRSILSLSHVLLSSSSSRHVPALLSHTQFADKQY